MTRMRARKGDSRESANKLISHPVYCAEVYRARGIFLQLLAEFENVIVHGPSRRIILISPNFVQQLVAADHPVGVLHQKLKGLELLGGQNDGLAVALDFHFLEVRLDAVKAHEMHI